jgi:hypothetical protein
MIVVDAIDNTLGIKSKRVRCIHISNRGCDRPPMIAQNTELEIQIDRNHTHIPWIEIMYLYPLPFPPSLPSRPLLQDSLYPAAKSEAARWDSVCLVLRFPPSYIHPGSTNMQSMSQTTQEKLIQRNNRPSARPLHKFRWRSSNCSFGGVETCEVAQPPLPAAPSLP